MPLDQDMSPQAESAQGQGASGPQQTINSGGGDVAGGDIDKRQGEVFVEGSTVIGDIIGGDKVGGDKVLGDKNIIIQPPPLPPALHQLRAPVGDFVGREREIETLMQALSTAASGGRAAAISGVRGLGGIGKTELAYAAALRLRAVFPEQILGSCATSVL